MLLLFCFTTQVFYLIAALKTALLAVGMCKSGRKDGINSSVKCFSFVCCVLWARSIA